MYVITNICILYKEALVSKTWGIKFQALLKFKDSRSFKECY